MISRSMVGGEISLMEIRHVNVEFSVTVERWRMRDFSSEQIKVAS